MDLPRTSGHSIYHYDGLSHKFRVLKTQGVRMSKSEKLGSVPTGVEWVDAE